MVGVLPEIILAVGAMAMLVLPGLRSARWLGNGSLVLLAGAFYFKMFEQINRRFLPQTIFSGMLTLDSLTAFFQVAVLAASALTIMSLIGYEKDEVRNRREIYSLVLLTTVGLTLLSGAQHLGLIYLGVELVSVLSYLMVGFYKKEALAIEAALKYFLFGAIATGAFLYGISLLYGLTGSFSLLDIAVSFPQALQHSYSLAWIGILLVIGGLGFKLALVPFHMWAPDAYEGAPAPIASFISLGPKVAAFAVMMRVLSQGITPQTGVWPDLLALIAVLSMTIGNVVALWQNNVKRMLAYSSIAHAGTMLIGLALATPAGTTALLFYLPAYLLMNAGAFLGVIVVGNQTGREDVQGFSGLSQRQPALAFMITVCLLSLAGIPPLAGFFAKMWIFGAAVKAGATWLAVVAAVNSVISLFYYVKVIKAMYLEQPAHAAAGSLSRSIWIALILCSAGLFLIGLWQGPWLELAAKTVGTNFNFLLY